MRLNPPMFYWDNAGPPFIWPLHTGPDASICPFCPGQPSPITGEFRLIQLIPPPSVDTSCLLAPLLWSSVAVVVCMFAFCTASLRSNWRKMAMRRRELCSLFLSLSENILFPNWAGQEGTVVFQGGILDFFVTSNAEETLSAPVLHS